MNKRTYRLAATIAAAIILPALPAVAQEAESPFSVSANVSLFSDYRFRGVSLSDEDMALQGGFDVEHESGFYLGTWGSSIESYNGAELELDIYGGYATEFDGTAIDFGVLLYSYPGGNNADYWEVYGSAGRTIGGADVTVGLAYVPSQDNVGNEDNIYVYGDLSYAIPETSFSLTGHFGYEDGAFGDGKTDWLLGVTYEYRSLNFGVSYVDTNQDGDGVDATILFSVGAAF